MLHQLVDFGRTGQTVIAPDLPALGDRTAAGRLGTRCPPSGESSSPEDEGTARVANIKSQEKRNLTNERARLRNQSVKSSLRTAVRGFREAVEAGDKAKAGELLVSAGRKLDKAVSKGVIHKNQAANKKSALAVAFNKL
jgi:small subunit ribosomal protein S20